MMPYCRGVPFATHLYELQDEAAKLDAASLKELGYGG